MGAHPLYTSQMVAAVDGVIYDRAGATFASAASAPISPAGLSPVRHQRKPVLIRGVGWAPDLFLRDDPKHCRVSSSRYWRPLPRISGAQAPSAPQAPPAASAASAARYESDPYEFAASDSVTHDIRLSRVADGVRFTWPRHAAASMGHRLARSPQLGRRTRSLG